MDSIWRQTAVCPRYGQVEGSLSTDVLVIGGGIAGILCAYRLQQAGVDVLVLEADDIGGGVTANTTAKITAQHGLCYHKLMRTSGTETAKLYLRANEEALEAYRVLCAQLDCGFRTLDNDVYVQSSPLLLTRELAALKKLGFPAERLSSLPLPFPIVGAVRFPRQAQFHPLRFLYGIADGLRIYTHSPVRSLQGTTALTEHGQINAKRVVIATHFPFLNKHGAYFLKLYQHRSYVLALENARLPEGMYVDEAKTGFSFREAEGLLLLGGGSHRTGKQGGGWQALRDAAARYYPGAVERFHWATQDCMTLDGIPYIGRYSPAVEHLYVATGFNKWGMTSAMAAAGLLSDLIQGKPNPYQALFDPARTMLRPQLAVNGAEAAVSLLTPTTPRCPHMGCALKWNPAEQSWDCPCHGSRFDGDGTLLENPATGNLRR